MAKAAATAGVLIADSSFTGQKEGVSGRRAGDMGQVLTLDQFVAPVVVSLTQDDATVDQTAVQVAVAVAPHSGVRDADQDRSLMSEANDSRASARLTSLSSLAALRRLTAVAGGAACRAS